jgi:hypothetical protein
MIVQPQVKLPVIEPASPGPYTDTIHVTIYCNTPGSTIYWTDDGSPVTSSSHVFMGTVVVQDTGTVIKAMAVADGMAQSNVASVGPYDLVTADPFFVTDGGKFEQEVTVVITEASSGAKVHYTASHDPKVDPADPTAESPVYDGEMTFLRAFTRLKAVAIHLHLGNSAVVMSKGFWVTPHAPHFSLSGGTFVGEAIVTVSSKTPDAELRCTLDGSIPDLNTAEHANPSDVLIVKTGTVVRCVATAHGQSMSAVTTSEAFGIKAFPPVFQPDGGSVIDFADVLISTKGGNNSTILYKIQVPEGLEYLRKPSEKRGQMRYNGHTHTHISMREKVHTHQQPLEMAMLRGF